MNQKALELEKEVKTLKAEYDKKNQKLRAYKRFCKCVTLTNELAKLGADKSYDVVTKDNEFRTFELLQLDAKKKVVWTNNLASRSGMSVKRKVVNVDHENKKLVVK